MCYVLVVGGGTCTSGQGPGCPTGTGTKCPTSPGPGASTSCTQGPGGQQCTASPGDGTNCDQEVPLMIEFHKGNGGDNPEYYVHRRNNGGDYYWVKLPGDELKDLLNDIGLHTKQDGQWDPRYEALEALLVMAGINGGPENGDLSTKLTGLKGDKLQILFTVPLSALLNVESISGEEGCRLEEAEDSCPCLDLLEEDEGETTLLELLLRQIEFDLTDSIVILLDKKNGSGGIGNGNYDGSSALTNLEPTDKGERINALNRNGDSNIKVSQDTNGLCACLTKYKYCVIQHDFSKAVGKLNPGCSAGIRFFIPTKENNSNYRELRLYGKGSLMEPEYLYYTKNGVAGGAQTCTNTCTSTCTTTGGQNCTTVYVVFYAGTDGNGCTTGKGDPRPLMLCYNGCWYFPPDEHEYFSNWLGMDGMNLEGCVCTTGTDAECAECQDTLLPVLTSTVGFLNRVELQIYPGMSTGGAQTTCQSGGSASPTTCDAGTNGSADKCTYCVHTFQSQKVQIQVECCSVPNSNGQSCYRKLIHTPVGMNGIRNGKNFRLGDVEYFKTDDSGEWGIIDYYQNGDDNTVNEKHKWNPLIEVSAYFYDEDKTYADPLLVELQFAKVDGVNGDKEYYYLKSNGGGELQWAKVENGDKTGLVNPDTLTKYLDSIRYCLKKTIRIQLEYNKTSNKTSYPLVGRDGKSGTGSPFNQPINGAEKKIDVKVEVQDCTKLTEYKCVKHKLDEALNGHHYKVAGLAFTLPGKNGQPVIEIQLYEAQGAGTAPDTQPICPSVPAPSPSPATCTPTSKSGPDQPITLTYNRCMGDICVYFYGTGGGTGTDQTDTVPLMLKYNGKFYCPCSRDLYFDRWVCVPELCTTGKKGECGCGTGAGCSTLAAQLDKVNEALNQIDLYPVKTNGQGYGLPPGRVGTSFDIVRVTLKEQTPGGDASKAYSRVVHQTKNMFRIGQITYCGKDITGGITPSNQTSGECTGDSGGPKIDIANGGAGERNGNHKDHTGLVNEVKANTVVAYYSKTDNGKVLPQLIVILCTTEQVKGNIVTGSNPKYGYYILASKNGGVGGGGGSSSEYQYQWRMVNGKPVPPGTPVTLDEKTDFSLLNAAVLLVEQTSDTGSPGQNGTYNESQIGPAIRSAQLTSPGNNSDINRVKGRQITVEEDKGPGSGTCQCLNSTGFKVMAHNLNELVTLGEKFNGSVKDVTLITGLRFLIPTPGGGGNYRLVNLKGNGPGGGENNGNIKYHQSKKDSVCVYFYGSDPRPLLICYNDWAYRAMSMGGYDKQQWHKVDATCDCKQPTGECKLVEALVATSNVLNPVDIEAVPMTGRMCKFYRIHRFNRKNIWIKVEATKSNNGTSCFKQYTHEHYGTGRGGCGFRLGNIHHGKTCIKENGSSTNNCVNSVLNGRDKPKTYKTADSVAVFYYKHDSKHETPVLVAMCTKGSGGGTGLSCGLYYVLKNRSGDTKYYTKKPEKLEIGDPKKLEKALEDALFDNSKRLQIVLSKRPGVTKYSPASDTATTTGDNGSEKIFEGLRTKNIRLLNDLAKGQEAYPKKPKLKSMLYHVTKTTTYKAQLCNGSPPEPKNTQITVEEIPCSNLHKGGYRCFRHKLVGATGIEDVGGLRLCLWTNGHGGWEQLGIHSD